MKRAKELYMENWDTAGLWLWYARNFIDVLSYILIFAGVFALCRMESFHLILEAILFVPLALVLLVASTVIIDLFMWVFSNGAYCIPFGALLLCTFLYRWYVSRRILKDQNSNS